MAGSSGAIKAGQAFVRLFAETNPLYRGLDTAAGKCKSWGGTIRSIGQQLGAGGGALLGPLVQSLKDAAGRGNLLGTLAANTGSSVESLGALALMAEHAGASVEQFAAAQQRLEIRTREQADANDWLFTNLQSLGPAYAFVGKTATEKMALVAEAIRRTKDQTQQLRIAQQVYGDEVGAALLPTLRGGAEAVHRFAAENAESAEQARAAMEATRAWNEILAEGKRAWRELGWSIMPTVEQVREFKGQVVEGAAVVRRWVTENRAAVVAVTAVASGLVVGGAAAAAFGGAVVTAGTAAALTVAAVKVAFGLLFSKVIIAGAIAAGIIYLLATETEKGRESVAYLADGFAAFGERVKGTFTGISDAIAGGDWKLAFEIGLAGLKAEWANFNFYLQLGWNVTKDVFVDGWRDAVAGIKTLFVELSTFVGRTVAAMVRNMVEQLARAASLAGGPAGLLLARRIRESAKDIPTDERLRDQGEAARARIQAERERERRDARRHRDGAAVDALRAREEARKHLGDLTALARARARFASLSAYEDFEDAGPGAGGGGGRANLRARLAATVKSIANGGNGASLGRQLAFGDSIPQQQLDATRGVLANTDQIPQMAQDINRIAQTSRVTR